MTLQDVARFQVPRNLVSETERALREAGADGYELFVLWSGKLENSVFKVHTCHVPKQESFKLDTGLCVRVSGDELHHLNMWLYKSDEMLGVQVHAHPTDAFHSDTDDSYPIVATLGGLSIVAANFCHDGLFTDQTALYRLNHKGWLKESPDVVEVVD